MKCVAKAQYAIPALYERWEDGSHHLFHPHLVTRSGDGVTLQPINGSSPNSYGEALYDYFLALAGEQAEENGAMK